MEAERINLVEDVRPQPGAAPPATSCVSAASSQASTASNANADSGAATCEAALPFAPPCIRPPAAGMGSRRLLACSASVVGAVIWRLLPSYAGRGWQRTPRKVLSGPR